MESRQEPVKNTNGIITRCVNHDFRQKTITQVLFLSVGIFLTLLTSCYSVRLQTTDGIPMPDPNSERLDFYRNMMVIERDTVIRIGKLENEFTLLIKDCESGALHTVEYRNTFGGILLSAVTFGKHRKVKIKYVCIKPSN